MEIKPYIDTVTGEIRYWIIVDADGRELAAGIATHQDAVGRRWEFERCGVPARRYG